MRANHVEDLRPLSDLGEVRVHSWVEQPGRTSLIFGFRLLPMDQDVDYATGSPVLVCIDPATRQPTP